MKVYRISKWAFGGICLLILLLPVSRNWKLLIRGEHTRGTVTGYVWRMEEGADHSRYPVRASEIEFRVDGIRHIAFGPSNYEYEAGRQVPVFYHPENPELNCVGTFSGIYLSNYLALPLLLLIFWYAFYLSFNNYYKRTKKRGEKPVKDIGHSDGLPGNHPLPSREEESRSR